MNYEFCDGVTHTIKKGDTLYEISRKYNVPLAILLRANPYVDVFNLQVGDTVCVPAAPGQRPPYPTLNGMPRPNDDNDRDDGDMDNGDRDNDRDDDDTESNRREAMEATLEERYREVQPEEVRENTSGRKWEKYVVQSGDTLADILEKMDGDMKDFLKKNSPATIYMLPGIAYYIQKSGR